MLLEVPASYKAPSGKWHHHIRQSDIERVRKCPELHRRVLFEGLKDLEGDKTIIGEAAHSVYHYWLRNLTDGNEITFSEGLAHGIEVLTDLWNGPNRMNVEVASLREAASIMEHCLNGFWNEVIDRVEAEEILRLEERFDYKVFEDHFRVIYITGTSDLETARGTTDFKNSGTDKFSGAKKWKLERYNAQSIIYPWARDMHDGIINNGPEYSTLAFDNDDELLPFTFINMNSNPKYPAVEIVEMPPVKVRDCKAMLREMLSFIRGIEAKVSPWPLGRNDWWCSSKWCPAWNDCIGKDLGEDPWDMIAKAKEKMNKGAK